MPTSSDQDAQTQANSQYSAPPRQPDPQSTSSAYGQFWTFGGGNGGAQDEEGQEYDPDGAQDENETGSGDNEGSEEEDSNDDSDEDNDEDNDEDGGETSDESNDRADSADQAPISGPRGTSRSAQSRDLTAPLGQWRLPRHAHRIAMAFGKHRLPEALTVVGRSHFGKDLHDLEQKVPCRLSATLTTSDSLVEWEKQLKRWSQASTASLKLLGDGALVSELAKTRKGAGKSRDPTFFEKKFMAEANSILDSNKTAEEKLAELRTRYLEPAEDTLPASTLPSTSGPARSGKRPGKKK